MRLYLHVGVGDDGAVYHWVDAVVSAENEVDLSSALLQGCLLHLRILLLLLLLFVLVPLLLFHKPL